MTKINSSHTRITHMYKHIYTCVFPDEKREGESDEGVYTLEGGGGVRTFSYDNRIL